MAEKLKVKNPWLSMWVKPRETIRAIVSFDPKYQFPLLSTIYGFPMLLNFAQSLSLGMNVHWGIVLLIAAILAPFAGMLGILITTTLLHWTGKWVSGKSTFLEMRAAVTWANVTNIVTSLTWLVLAFTFGQLAFVENFSSMTFMGWEKLLIFFLFLIQAVVSVWSIVIFVKAVAEVQKFSAWKGLLNLVLPVIIVILVAWAIGLVVGCTTGQAPQV